MNLSIHIIAEFDPLTGLGEIDMSYTTPDTAAEDHDGNMDLRTVVIAALTACLARSVKTFSSAKDFEHNMYHTLELLRKNLEQEAQESK